MYCGPALYCNTTLLRAQKQAGEGGTRRVAQQRICLGDGQGSLEEAIWGAAQMHKPSERAGTFGLGRSRQRSTERKQIAGMGQGWKTWLQKRQ